MLGRPRGAGPLYDPVEQIEAAVGNGFKNEMRDVRAIQRGLSRVRRIA